MLIFSYEMHQKNNFKISYIFLAFFALIEVLFFSFALLTKYVMAKRYVRANAL